LQDKRVAPLRLKIIQQGQAGVAHARAVVHQLQFDSDFTGAETMVEAAGNQFADKHSAGGSLVHADFDRGQVQAEINGTGLGYQREEY